jgi:peptidoglycan/xylan/chitin deacetylase (PgdA/CDA1 family)
LKYLYNPPVIIKKAFSSFKWTSSTEKILLTFDDGPCTETTETILKVLNENKIKAVFFCVGNNINLFPELTNLILNEGHVIGNHTFNHKKLTQLSFTESLQEINSFTVLLKDNFNYEVKYFRPPHGKFKISTPSLIRKCGLENVMWSLLSYDYKNDIKVVKLAIDKYLRNDSIVVMHDSKKSMNVVRDSINMVLETASKKGFEIGEPHECLK